jgi:hypothetical protein
VVQLPTSDFPEMFWLLQGVGTSKEMKNEIERIGNSFEVIENDNLLHAKAIRLKKKH